jgi:hypothetical protein|tara:strand:+ start:712 stop:1035 length:324 start_codon:yes stop_codon:yes gene_type:complete
MISDKLKKVVFSVKENDKVQFKLQLHIDGLSQRQFFHNVIQSYIEKDEHLMKYIEHLKLKLKSQSKANISKTNKNLADVRATRNDFALGDDEVESIFDILEQEHPDL